MRFPKTITLLTAFVLLLFAGALVAALTRPVIVEARAAEGPQAPQTAPPPGTTQTTVVATPQAGYVGSETCAGCHSGYDATVNTTKHGFTANPRRRWRSRAASRATARARRTPTTPDGQARCSSTRLPPASPTGSARPATTAATTPCGTAASTRTGT